MTSSRAQELERRKSKPARERLTLAGDLRSSLLAALQASTQVRFPSDRYQKDPVAFCREVLGVEPWSAQVRIMEAVRDHKRVAVSSGHKIGKSRSAAILALWFYCSHESARVIMTSVTSRQVDQILWRELRMLRSRSAVPIDGEQGELARTGLKSLDFREIVGFTARESEAVAGISGPNLLYIIDEASGVDPAIYEAIEGNRAGGARIVMFSNPTRTDGEFFAAFNSKKDLYHSIYVSSEETPNVVEGHTVIPGLATREWVEEKKQEWGEDSPLYTVRVRGRFATKEDGKIFSIARITEAEARWATTPFEGRLYIGVDPAGPTGTGDETVFALRRKHRVMSLQAQLGLNEDAILVTILGLISQNVERREPIPVVVIDSEGSIGAGLFGRLRQYVDSKPKKDFELVALRASDRAIMNPAVYDKIRDELAANLESWFREGGTIPEDTKLNTELHLWEWKRNEANGRYKLHPSKDDVRKVIKRSPDRYDALALACWEPMSLREGIEASGETIQRQILQNRDGHLSIPDFSDPYSSGAWTGPRRPR